MCFFFSLIPATIWVIIGFFVLFTATKAEGKLRTFGRVLAVWTFFIAALFPLGGAYVSISGKCPLVKEFQAMHDRG